MKILVRAAEGSTEESGLEQSVMGTRNDLMKTFTTLIRKTQISESQSSALVFNSQAGFHLPSVLNLVMDAGCFSATLAPIKIELSKTEDMHARATDLDSAIILHNLALVHRSVALKEESWEKRGRIQKAALRLFRMCFALVSSTPLPQGLRFVKEQKMIRNRVHGSAIFLYYQTRTLFDMGRHDEASATLHHLTLLGSELADMMDGGFSGDTGSATAVAA